MSGHRRPVAVALVATVVAGALQAGAVTTAHAAPSGAAPTVDAAQPPTQHVVTDADARAGAVAAVVPGPDGSPEIVPVTAPTVAEARRRAADVPGAVSVAVDAPVSIAAEPWRPYQWSHTKLDVDSLPATDTTGTIVAVVDSGVRASHEDFDDDQVRCLPGSNFVPDGAVDACTDPNGHGTHVAGILAAAVNGKGISGIAPGTTILPVRVLDANGVGGAFAVAEGIVWAANQGASVINASLGGPFSEAHDDAVAYATAKGALVVAAAGNNRQTGNSTNWPAASPGALSVASTTQSGETSSFSYEGREVDLAAPGSDIVSLGVAHDSHYVGMSGTSMAAPAVAAVAALFRSRNHGSTPDEVTDALLSTASDIEAPGRDDRSGAGLVNPVALLTDQSAVTAPAAPTGVRAQPGDGVVTVAFDAVPSTDGAPVASYTLYRDGDLLRTVGADAGATSHVVQDRAVTNGVTYAYQVTATGPGGESARSEAVSAQPQAEPAPPAAPQGLTATAGDGSVTLAWTTGAASERAPVRSYRVHRADAGPVATVDGTTFVDRDVRNGTTYSYSVTAVGPGGESAGSGAASATPTAPTPPGGGGTDAAPTTPVAPAPVANPAPPVAAEPVVEPAPVVAPAPPVVQPAPPVVQPAPPVVTPAPRPAAPVLRPLPARVARGQRLAVVGSAYRPGSVLTVTHTYQVRERVTVRQPVTALVTRRVTVDGKTVTRKVRVVTGHRTVRVLKLVTRSTRLADLRVAANGTVARHVLPVRGVAGGVLTVKGVDRTGRASVVSRAFRIG